jgi:hypothetical protein
MLHIFGRAIAPAARAVAGAIANPRSRPSVRVGVDYGYRVIVQEKRGLCPPLFERTGIVLCLCLIE